MSRRIAVAEQGPTWPDSQAATLLDVNVLIALLDPLHIHHSRAQGWFAAPRSWASCAITLNGAMRIMAHPRYSNPMDTVAEAADLLSDLCAHPGHRFWSNGPNLLDSPLVDRSRLLASQQVTDSYLLALAVHHGGRLASFDQRLVTSAVRDGSAALELIP